MNDYKNKKEQIETFLKSTKFKNDKWQLVKSDLPNNFIQKVGVNILFLSTYIAANHHKKTLIIEPHVIQSALTEIFRNYRNPPKSSILIVTPKWIPKINHNKVLNVHKIKVDGLKKDWDCLIEWVLNQCIKNNINKNTYIWTHLLQYLFLFRNFSGRILPKDWTVSFFQLKQNTISGWFNIFYPNSTFDFDDDYFLKTPLSYFLNIPSTFECNVEKNIIKICGNYGIQTHRNNEVRVINGFISIWVPPQKKSESEPKLTIECFSFLHKLF